MKTDKVMKDNKNLKLISLVSIIGALIIMIAFNFEPGSVRAEYNLIAILPIFVLLISYIFIIERIKVKKNSKAYYYLIPIGLIMISNFIVSTDMNNRLLNLIVLPILISIFFFSLTNTNYKLSKESFRWLFKFFPGSLFYNFEYFRLSGTEDKKKKTWINVLIGCLIGFVIGGILLTLLTSADKYFSEFMSGTLDVINRFLRFGRIGGNAIILGISFVILFCSFINILKNRNQKMKEGKIYNITNSLGITLLIIVNFVFVLFLISEISKLTTNFLHVPVEYTYSEYAREGFFQLLGVTSINFLIIMYFLYYTNKIKDSKAIKIFLLILIGFSIILVFNAYYRMFLYVGEYGFTILRSQVLLFLTMELILFILLIIRTVKSLKLKDARIYYVVLVTTYILNLYICNQALMNSINKLFNFVTKK